MTRINTNVSSLVAQNRLQNSNNDLQESLTRLSTGLRINTGSDDPAGLLASEALRGEITGLTKSISNTQRASQIISTADSALGQVSNLLNDVRGLVVEASNSGALSKEEIAANQLQIDSSLEAINRIAQTTTFQGRKLLDGSQDFVSTIGAVSSVKDVSIDQASLGTASQLNVSVDIKSAATQATTTIADTAFNADNVAETTSTLARDSVTLAVGTETLTIYGSEDDLASIEVTVDNAKGAVATASNSSGAITVEIDGDSNTSTAQDVLDALNGLDGIVAVTDGAGTQTITAAVASANASADTAVGLKVVATGNEEINLVFAAAGVPATPAAAYNNSTNTITVTLGATASNNTLTAIEAAIDGLSVAGKSFDASVVDNGGAALAGFGDLRVDDATAAVAGTSAQTTVAGLKDSLVFQLNGADGAETFNFGVGTLKSQIKDAINLVSDSTGITADDTTTLQFTSEAYGSDALVGIDVISEGGSGGFEAALSAARVTGTDILATINGVEANGNGNSFSINTSTLDLSLTVDDGNSTDFSFSITGGGATFQLGPDVTSTQQATLGIGSVSTGKLGGASGRLYELGSGQAKSLANDVSGAAKIIDEVIAKVVGTRGRLGSFQATTLESNLVSLNETRANLQEAESSIRDADFAQESANLTRAQILVQSGTNVLSLANQNPQNVLALLR
ncbi:MAG: flagellin [Planctomycetota bacterium]